MSDKKTLHWRPLWMTIGWMQIFAVFYLSLMRIPPEIVTFDMADKIYHLFTYLILMVWFAQIYPSKKFISIALLLLVMGILIEILQGQTEHRYFEYLDIVANSSGVLIGYFVVKSPIQYGLVRLERTIFKSR